ncbi:MAG: ABC transporter substrate-binding protein [Paracoccaceae bacterium]
MRIAVLAAVLTGLAAVLPAAGFEVEAQRSFGADTAAAELRIISTVDLDLFEPLLEEYQSARPGLRVIYTAASSAELFKALNDEGALFDVAISSAMDLQTKLANDGIARRYRSAATDALPVWARWSDRLFAFTQEPAVVIASKSQLRDLPLPANRKELIQLLRSHPGIFDGRVGTYDVRVSGLGYLFATQDIRQSQDFWRLAEVLGSLGARVFCCSGEMIDAIENGEIALAYNVLGSYVERRLDDSSDVVIVPMQDYTHVMLRTVLIPRQAPNPAAAGEFVDFLLSPEGRGLVRGKVGLPPIDGGALTSEQNLRPIRLGPGLLVYLDRIKRENFLVAWSEAVVQP